MKFSTRILFYLLFFIPNIYSLPYYTVDNYHPADYNADTQNWQMDYSSDGNLYIGNNSGLLCFNGNQWKLFELPKKTVVRSVLVQGDRIYIGSRHEIGYWIKKNNTLEYISLSHLLTKTSFSNEEFWSIKTEGKMLYFQSFSRIVAYDGKRFETITEPHAGYMLLQKNQNGLFVQKMGGELYRIQGTKLIPLKGTAEFKDRLVKLVLTHPKIPNTLLIGLNNGEIYQYDEINGLSLWSQTAKAALAESAIDAGAIFNKDELLIGTLGKGLFHFSANGEVIKHIDTNGFLQSNVVHAIKVVGNQVWVSLDTGISRIDNTSPFLIVKGSDNFGTIFDAVVYQNALYFATNQGLYRSDLQVSRSPMIIPSIKGWTMSLISIKNQLICGTEYGTFKIYNDQIDKLSDVNGSVGFRYVADAGEEFLLQGTFSHFVYYKYSTSKGWIPFSIIKECPYAIQQFEVESVRRIWATNPDDGVLLISLNNQLDGSESIKRYGVADGLPSLTNLTLVKIDNLIVVHHPEGFFSYNRSTNRFEEVTFLNKGIHEFGPCEQIYDVGNSEYITVNKNSIALFNIKDQKVKLLGSLPFDAYNIQLIKNNFRVISLKNGKCLLPTVQGIAMVDLDKLRNFECLQRLTVNEISYIDKNGIEQYCNDFQNIAFPSTIISLKIQLSVSAGANNELVRYRFEGQGREWSKWSKHGVITIQKPQVGNYSLEIESYNGKKIYLPIQIMNPWYKSKLFLLVLLVIIIVVILFSVYQYNNTLRKKLQRINQHKQLLHEKEIRELQNAQLQHQLQKQYNEILLQTSLLSQKRQVLDDIGAELEKQKEILGDRYPNKLYLKLKEIIEENRNNKSEWSFFEAYFNEAHHDFTVRLKEKYPTLTNTDLRFCCLLRMNLSSKEIATLLSMSFRSVELARYRLRTKFGLQTKDNLVDYIMAI